MNSLKNLVVGAVIGLMAAVTVSAVEILPKSFLNGTNLLLSSSSTNTYGATNVYTLGGVSTTNAAAMKRLTLQKNPDGSNPSYAIGVSLVGTNATGTNIATFTFRAVPVTGGRAATASQNQFSFAVTGTGTTAVVLSTNLPAATFQGCKEIEFYTVGTPGAGTTLTIERVDLLGGM